MQEEFRALLPDELDECLDLWGNVFERVGRGYFPPYFRGDPWFKLEYTRVCSVDGRLVSAVQICRRSVRVGSAEIVMGGIGNVGTYPEYRGKGYSSRLLKDSVRVMQTHGFDFSVLFTGIQPFYERIGWKSVPIRVMTGRLKPGLSAGGAEGYAIRQADWDIDLSGIRDVYDAFNASRPLTVCRTPDYWEGYARPRLGTPDNAVVAESKGEIAGYVLSPSDSDVFRVQELGHLPGHEACIKPLIDAAAGRARNMGAGSVWANMPFEPAVVSAVESVVDEAQANEYTGGMFRIIDIRSIGKRMLPELNRRAAADPPPSGEISLDTEFGSLTLSVSADGVVSGVSDPEHIAVSQSDFFSLLFGLKAVDDLVLPCTGTASAILSALFPPQHPVFWGPDHF